MTERAAVLETDRTCGGASEVYGGRWHKFVHRMNWHRGKVVSWTTAEKRIMIGFQCDKCGAVTGALDATGIVDRDVAQVLRVAERKRPTAPGEAIAEPQPEEGTHDHCNCYRLHGRKCCICDSEPEPWEIQGCANDAKMAKEPDFMESDRLEAVRFADAFIEEVNADHNDIISMSRDAGCRIRDHIETLRKAAPPVTIPGEQRGDTPQEPWEIQCGAQDPDGWCCGLSTGHAGDHNFHASVWGDVFRKSPEAVAKDDPYTECAKAMCEMCDGQPNAVVKPISIGNGKYFHTMHNSPFRKFCKASPIWEKVKGEKGQ